VELQEEEVELQAVVEGQEEKPWNRNPNKKGRAEGLRRREHVGADSQAEGEARGQEGEAGDEEEGRAWGQENKRASPKPPRTKPGKDHRSPGNLPDPPRGP
jgi:hypothetical protein